MGLYFPQLWRRHLRQIARLRARAAEEVARLHLERRRRRHRAGSAPAGVQSQSMYAPKSTLRVSGPALAVDREPVVRLEALHRVDRVADVFCPFTAPP